MPSTHHVSRFLDDVYAAAVAPQRWGQVVESFAKMLGREHAQLNIIDLRTGQIRHNLMHGFDPEMIRLGHAYYFQHDAFAIAARDTMRDALLAGTGGHVMVSREVIAPEALERTEYYADFVRRWGVNDMLSATAIIKKQTALSLVANPNNLQRFEDIDKQLVMRLWPDINRAFHLCMKIGMAETAGAMGLAWDHARQPVLLVQQGQLVYANACAERTLRTSSVIARSAGSLRFHDEAANAALRELSRPRELRNLAGNRRNASLMVHGSDGEAWLVQMVALQQQERPGPAAWFSTDPGVFITLSPVNAAAATRTGMVESLVQFTAVEREILLGLADGRSVEQIARLSGRRTSTVRWHVRNMLEKTGLKSLSDLARFVSLLLPF